MEAQQVVEKILADAKAQAEKIKSEANQKDADDQAKFNQQLDEFKKQTEIIAQKAANDEKLHLLAAARMDIAGQSLAEKNKILDEVFTQARRQLQNLPDDEYQKLCSKLTLAAVETGNEEVIIDKNETRIDQAFIDQINKKFNSKSKGNLKLSDKRQNIGGGFILKRGRIKNNVSFDVLLAQARKELEIELAKELFQN